MYKVHYCIFVRIIGTRNSKMKVPPSSCQVKVNVRKDVGGRNVEEKVDTYIAHVLQIGATTLEFKMEISQNI